MRYSLLLTPILSVLFVPALVLPGLARPIAPSDAIASLPPDSLCFIQTPDHRLIDLSQLCGQSEPQSDRPAMTTPTPIAEKPMFLNRRRGQVTFSDGSQPRARSGGRCPGIQVKFCPPASFMRRMAQQQANPGSTHLD